MKLPRKLEAHPQLEALESLLCQGLRPLWEKGTIQVPSLSLSLPLEEALSNALRFKHLERGIERIGQVLDIEKKGLLAVQAKQGSAPVNRVSRILLITNDGVERFYRACESTLLQHRDRVLCFYVDTDSARMGLKLFGPEKPVKALLVSDKESVSQVLLALVK